MHKKSMFIASALSLAVAVNAVAAEKKVGDKSEKPEIKSAIPTVLANAQKNGNLEIYKEFKAIGGLHGWVVKEGASGRHLVVYTTPDNEALVAGMVLDKDGRNMTNTYASEHIPAMDYTPAFNAFNKEASSVVVGSVKAKAEVTVVFDANCGYCKALHKLLQPSVDAGELRVRYVPVAILGQDSDTKGAGILASKSPTQAINGGDVSSDKDLVAKVRENTSLMKQYNFSGTPVVLYKAGKGTNETLYVAPGVPNMKEMFSRLGISGQQEKLKTDPSLARFL